MLASSAVVMLNQPHLVQVKILDHVQRASTVLLAQENQTNVPGARSLMCNSWKMKASVRNAQKVIIVESLAAGMSLDLVILDSIV